MGNRPTPYEEWKPLADAVRRLGEVNAACEEFGLKPMTGRNRYISGKARYWGRYCQEVPEAAADSMVARQGYAPDHDMTKTVPDGFHVKGVSTLYDADGNVRGQWVKSSIDAQRQEEIRREMLAGLSDELPREPPVALKEMPIESLLAGYPIGDHHLGMLAWREETGADYDLSIAEETLARVSESLIESSKPCAKAVIAVLGDFMHYDSHQSVTPTNRNLLDTDTRFPKMVRAAIRCLRRMIRKALEKHAQVHVVVEIGNHDLASAIWLMEALSVLYEYEPRVTVDNSPAHYHYLRFGKCLIGTHHGDGAKMDKLPLIMATDRPEDWGQTDYRYWWTGHIHHDAVKDIEGCRVESFRILAPSDAWARNKGYRSAREMKAIIMHKEYGEVGRISVTPEMVA